MKKNRARYRGFPLAQGSPKVLLGATLSSSTFWHGRKMDRWANEWVNYWTEGKETTSPRPWKTAALYNR